MFQFRPEQVEAFRKPTRAGFAERLSQDLASLGLRVQQNAAEGVLAVFDPRGHPYRLSFRPDGLPAALRRPSGAEFRFEYDEQGRLQRVGYPDGTHVELERDERGNILQLSVPGVSVYRLEYDVEDRLISVLYPDRTTVYLAYGPAGRLSSLTDRAGGTTLFQRAEDGRLQSITDPLGFTTEFHTDERGDLRTLVFPDGRKEEYALDRTATLSTVTMRDGRQVVRELDAVGAVKRVEWPDGEWAAFDFDEDGRIVRAQNQAETIVYTLDTFGNPVSEATSAGTVEYSYDPEGRLTSITAPHRARIEYDYDEDGRLSLVRDWNGRENHIVYASDGSTTKMRYWNGLEEELRYGYLGRPVEAVVTHPDHRVVSHQGYTYDACERLTGITDVWGPGPEGSSSRWLEYGPQDRILAEIDTLTGKRHSRYSYDLNGNLIADCGVYIRPGCMGEPLRYGEQRIEYDALGHMVRVPGDDGEMECRFTADSVLREIRSNRRALRFDYDPLCRRVLKSDGTATWRYGWAGHQLLWEEFRASPESEPVRRDYLWLPGSSRPFAFLEGGRTYWLQSDPRGAAIRAFDQGGEVVWRASYGSFGDARIEVAQVRQPWRLMGHYCDAETGLHYCRTRYYSPLLKSYLSRDPRWLQSGATCYSYAASDPWNRADPSGTVPSWLGGLLAPLTQNIASAALGENPSAALPGVAAGAVAGVTSRSPVGFGLGGSPGVVLEALARGLVEQWRKGDLLCLPCALGTLFPAAAPEVALFAPHRPASKAAANDIRTPQRRTLRNLKELSLKNAVTRSNGGKCEKIAKRVSELKDTLNELRARLHKLKRLRDEVKHLKNMCPAWQRRKRELLEEDKEVQEQHQNLNWQIVEAKSRLAECLERARIYGGVYCGDLEAALVRLKQQKAAIEVTWQKIHETEEKIRSNLRRCPNNLADLDEDLRNFEDRIAQIEEKLTETEKELRQAEQELQECLKGA